MGPAVVRRRVTLGWASRTGRRAGPRRSHCAAREPAAVVEFPQADGYLDRRQRVAPFLPLPATTKPQPLFESDPMASKTWTLINQRGDDFSDHLGSPLSLGRSELSAEPRLLHGGLRDGVLVLHLRSDDFRCSLLPTRGMAMWRAQYQDEQISWQSPVNGPVHPKFVDLGEPSGLGWLDGFDELLARCGLESNGAPEFSDSQQLIYPLHGRIGNKPAHELSVTIDDEAEEITVIGVVDEVRFHFLKLRMTTTVKLKRGEQGFRIRDEVRNLSESPAEIQMLYHTNFGIPLLDAGARVVAPVRRLVPRNDHAAAGLANWDSYEAPQPGFEEQVYFLELIGDAEGQTQALLRNAHGNRGVSLHYNINQLPCFSVWKNTTSVADGCVTGIEPGTNFPNPRSFEGEHGRVVKLAPRAAYSFDYRLAYHSDATQVEAAERAVADLQRGTEPQIDSAPQPDWCA